MGFLDAFLFWGGIVLFALLLLGILIDIVALVLEIRGYRREREECDKRMVELTDSLADSILEGSGK